MGKGGIAAIVMVMAAWAGWATADDMTSLQGSWTGPWYIGMSSGIATVEIAADGSGQIAVTNLETFGASPVPLVKTDFDGKAFRFSATGSSPAEFSAILLLEDDGRKMRGDGKFGGLRARLELQRMK